MDEQVRWSAANFEPDIPFRAVSSHRHATWAHTWHSRPELYIQPESTAEIQKIVHLARRCRRHVVVVGSGHSPSDLTCTSSWKVNLDKYNEVLEVDQSSGIVVMQAGVRLWQIQEALEPHGLALPNVGSIVAQSIAGAIATGTHGSSLRHGILSENVLALKLVLADGTIKSCSRQDNVDLFRAALVSLGALGVVIEVTFQAVPEFKVQWTQKLEDLSYILDRWDKGLWTDSEFVRVWWMPYMKKCIYWKADKTDLPLSNLPKKGLLDGKIGFHVYQLALYVANWIPSLLPYIERIVGKVQYGSSRDGAQTAVQRGRDGLQMDCLYSQFVNEWALPLDKGPEALTRLSAWLHGDKDTANIPFLSDGIYVHAPVEVRVSSGHLGNGPRAFLDPTSPDQPTLYLNATLYRPYHSDPPCMGRYYKAFEYLMKQLGGRPHWAKCFTAQDLAPLYPDMHQWMAVRDEVDPQGMFFGDWHRRNLIGNSTDEVKANELGDSEKRGPMPLEESLWASSSNLAKGGRNFYGEITRRVDSPPASVGSFDMMDHGDAEMSTMLDSKFVGDE